MPGKGQTQIKCKTIKEECSHKNDAIQLVIFFNILQATDTEFEEWDQKLTPSRLPLGRRQINSLGCKFFLEQTN